MKKFKFSLIIIYDNILDGSPTANQSSQNIDQMPSASSEETPITSSLYTPCSSFEKRYPDCSAKLNIIEVKTMANKSFFMLKILELNKKILTLCLDMSERNLKGGSRRENVNRNIVNTEILKSEIAFCKEKTTCCIMKLNVNKLLLML